jgi:hypothetical protein
MTRKLVIAARWRVGANGVAPERVTAAVTGAP